MYKAVTYGSFQIDLPEFTWGVSVSVDVFNFSDQSPYRVYWQTEPNEILNHEEKLIRNSGFYDLILCWNSQVLSQCGNAVLFPPGAVWTQESDTSQKKFAISYLISSKTLCGPQKYRQDIFNSLPAVIGPLELPITKYKSPPWLPDKRSMLVPFQYSIVMENAMQNNYFTEKLNDCMATKTIPIYWGAPNIGEFYNPEGILSWEGTGDLFNLLERINEGYYRSRKDAIEENYQRALKYADRTGNVARAIIDSWTPKIARVHSGQPNESGERS